MTQKLTHKERAEAYFDFELESAIGSCDGPDAIKCKSWLIKSFTQVANEALEEAAIKVESFDRSIRVETDNDCTAYDISAEIRALKKDQVKS